MYRGQQEAIAEFLPLDAENWITCGNALRLDWMSVCPPTGAGLTQRGEDLFDLPLSAPIEFENEGGETYVCGNPPYVGDKYQTPDQKRDLQHLNNSRQAVRAIDYIVGWFWKASEYIALGGQFAFVSTNSICQGIQVPLMWPRILARGQSISFAHQNFLWGNNASNKAQVTCVIVGVSSPPSPKKYIYSNDSKKLVDNINPYLIASRDIIIDRAPQSISSLAPMVGGNIPRDQGNLLLSSAEKNDLVAAYPQSDRLLKSIVGSSEFINGEQRYCLWVSDEDAELAYSIPPIAERLERVRAYRSDGSERGRMGLATPYKFERTIVCERSTIVIPSVSSERRLFLPCGVLDASVIVSNKCYALYDADLFNLSLIASTLHRVWISAVCTRMRTDYSYSNSLVWNTFPVPKLTEQNRADLTECAVDILLAREAHWPSTIADLYDPEKMPEDLRHAHDRNDETLERIYVGRRFRNDTERLEKLFELYTKMTATAAKGRVARAS